MFSWTKFKNGRIAVNCGTEKKAVDFLKKCDKKGIKWCDGDPPSYTCWEVYKGKTCYICSDYGNLQYSILCCQGNRKIINWEIY